MNSNVLKRPTGVYILAVLFLFAPIGNILISFAGSGVQNWYELDVIIPFLHTIPAWDWVWLGLLSVTGILLFFPHKLSWSIAIFTLFLVLGVNVFRLYSIDSNSIDIHFLKVFSVLAILCTMSILIIALYFRFPYLDRRAKWFSKEPRFDAKTEVYVNSLKGFTDSISLNGCKIFFEEVSDFPQNSKLKIKFFEISNIEIEADLIESKDKYIRVSFINSSHDFKQDLGRWLKNRGT